ncbi:MAG: ABC transporter permease, partial [Bacteroidota bacterium]
REYSVRVKKKSFIIITLVSPLIMVGLMVLPAVMLLLVGSEQKKIAVKDEAGIVSAATDTLRETILVRSDEPLDLLKATYRAKGFDGVLHIPASILDTSQAAAVTYFSEGEISLSVRGQTERMVEDLIESHNIKAAGLTEHQLKNFKRTVVLNQREIAFNDKGELVETDKKNSAGIATGIGFAAGLITYIVLIFYGAMIMRSVMEEKTNRIVEVIISSVKPIQLMLGKIIGVSGVGLTQMLVWIVLSVILLNVAGLFLPIDPAQMQSPMQGMQQMPPEAAVQSREFLDAFLQQNWAFILPTFLFFFLGGYFIYSSLFAAVGSAMGDDMGEGQSLSFVAMFPIIISFIMISPVIENPTGGLARWLSIIPLFSPVLMPARLAFDPPIWEVILSAVVLMATAFFFVWLSARIYRVGILMYGKKASLKEIGKWMVRG